VDRRIEEALRAASDDHLSLDGPVLSDANISSFLLRCRPCRALCPECATAMRSGKVKYWMKWEFDIKPQHYAMFISNYNNLDHVLARHAISVDADGHFYDVRSSCPNSLSSSHLARLVSL